MKRNHIPSAMSLVGIMLGGVAVAFFLVVEWVFLGVIFVLLSGLIDRYDGRLARRLGAESKLGAYLDALNDMVSFGVAPMALYLAIGFAPNTLHAVIVVATYLLATAWRLRRFIIPSHPHRRLGLPSTIAGTTLVVVLAAGQSLSDQLIGAVLSTVVIIALMALMVSRLPIPKK